MTTRKTVIAAALAGIVLAGTALAADRAAEARFRGGLKALGFQAILDETQKEEAREILSDHLAATAPDRLSALSRLIRFRADVAAVLTEEQRRKAGKLRTIARKLPEAKRRRMADRLLDLTDRAALADLAERHEAAGPGEKVALGFRMLDLLVDALEADLRRKLTLTGGQVAEIRALWEELKTDLRPVADRLSVAKEEVKRRGLAILDAGQREKLQAFGDDLRTKILDFLRG